MTETKPRYRVPAGRMADGLTSMVSGIGTAKDKMSSLFYAEKFLTDQQLVAAYRHDWVARKAVDIPAKDGTREWRAWQAEDEQIELIEAEEKRLKVQAKVEQAWIRARLYGGAALVMGDGSANPATPLDPERVRKDGLQYLHVFARTELTAGDLERDIASAWFGEPSVYRLRSRESAQIDIHPSRVIRFIGNPLPDEWNLLAAGTERGWGDSVLLAIDDALKQSGLVMGGIATLVNEAKVDIVKVKDMMANLATREYEAQLIRRFALANQLKSIVNSIVLDSEEDWETRQIQFGGLPEMVRTYLMIASAAADVPATRFLGQSPTGLSSTGESDIRNYYDRVSSDQKNQIGPALERLDEVLIRSALGNRPDEIYYNWRPLWQMSDEQKATIAKQKADAIKVYSDADLVPHDALAKSAQNMLVEDGLLPGLEAALVEFPDDIDEGDPQVQEQFTAADAKPRTLYVRRNVLNASEIIAWARSQGFETTLPADDMHVTIAFSRQPVDWLAVGDSWSGSERNGGMEVSPGGPRLVERFEGSEATVLMFASSELAWRHEEIKRKGASWDHPEYQPHITLSYAFTGAVDEVEPYRGRIVLGHEIFEEINEDWKSGVTEVSA